MSDSYIANPEVVTPITYRVPEIARMLGVATSTAYRLVNSKELPSIRIGRSVRVLRRDWEPYLARKRREAHEPTR